MFLRARAYWLAFEGDDDKTGDQTDDKTDDKTDDDKTDDNKMFNQDEVNTILATEKRKFQEKQRATAKELEDLKKNSKLTEKEREDLQKRIEDLQSQYMTAEEKARQESERTTKEHTETLKSTIIERDSWKEKHEQLAINTEIAQAAIDFDAIRFEQIAALLSSKTKLVEQLDDDGQPTGEYEPRVSFPDIGKDKKPVVLELAIDEAVKRMTELPQYANLFRTAKKSGLGGTGSTTAGKKINIAKIAASSDQREYRKLRKERPDLLE